MFTKCAFLAFGVYAPLCFCLYFGEKNGGNYKDDPNLITKQMNRYVKEHYPPNNSLAVTMQLLRRHNQKDCIKAMEKWWEEIKYNSKRDQLSFNYIAWKQNLKFNYIEGDARNNEFFSVSIHTGKK